MRAEGPRPGYQSLQLRILLCTEAETGDHANKYHRLFYVKHDIWCWCGDRGGRCRCGLHLCAETSHTVD